MKDTFTITVMERYKELGPYLVGVKYSESKDLINWTLICKGSKLDKISEFLKSNNYSCILKKGEDVDEVEVEVNVKVDEKMFVGSYIPKEIDKLYDEFYVKIKECIEEVKDYAD